MSVTGHPDEPPVRLGIGAIDLGTALWATVGIQAALRTHADTGAGTLVEVSLFETAAWWLSYLIAGYMGSGEVPQRHGSGAAFLAPYEVFATAEGDLMVSCGNDQLFAALCEGLEMPELLVDPAFHHNASRVAAPTGCTHCSRSGSRPGRPRNGRRSSGSVQSPCSPVRTVADFVADEPFAALGMLTALPDSGIPDLRVVDTPLNADGRRPTHRLPPPLLGEHTGEILSELGFSAEEVDHLRRVGVVGIPGTLAGGVTRCRHARLHGRPSMLVASSGVATGRPCLLAERRPCLDQFRVGRLAIAAVELETQVQVAATPQRFRRDLALRHVTAGDRHGPRQGGRFQELEVRLERPERRGQPERRAEKAALGREVGA